MKIQKSFKFRFYPTPEQEKQLAIEFGCARFVWNHCLNLRQHVYTYSAGITGKGEGIGSAELSKHLTFLKHTKNFGWLKEGTAAVHTQKLIDLDSAYKNFFEGRAKFPQFKKKGHAESIRYQLDQRRMPFIYKSGKFIKLPNLGQVNVVWSRMPDENAMPKMATVSKTASGKYFVSFMCEIEQTPKPSTGRIVGVDVGIKDVIVTSDGYSSGAPKFTYKYQRELKRAQRKLSKKTKGSNGWKKQRLVVARIHEKIANCRKDFLHKQSHKLVTENDIICLEDLNVKGMMANKRLSKAVADVGLFELNRQIEYKAAWYGKKVIKVGRFYPSTKTCSQCGAIRPMKLSDRTYSCECGLKIDRDFNAAINIKNEGLRLAQ